MSPTIPILVLAAMPLLAAAGPAPQPAPAVRVQMAHVNGETITDVDLKGAFVGKHGGHTVFLGGDTETRRFLDIVINERLLVQEAYTLGLDQDPAVKPQVDAFRDSTSAEHLLKLEIEERSAPTPEEIQAAWDVADQLFVAREIIADTRDEAESIRMNLLQGADFEAMARSCSIAPSRTRGGNLSPFTWGSLSPAVEDVVFDLEPGEISAVFRTPEGWSLLQLVNRLDAARPALDDRVSARIAARLKERKKAKRTEELSEMLWQKYEAEVLLDDVTPLALSRLLEKAPETVVAEWNGGQLTVKGAFTPGELKMFGAFAPGRAAERTGSTLRSAVNTALIRLEAKARKIEEVPAVAEAVDKYEARLMESVLYSKHVLKHVKVEEDEVRAAYEARKEKLLIGEKRRIAHIAVATEKEAKDLHGRIRRGEDFGELVKKYTLDKPSAKTGGDLGWIEKGKVAEKYDVLFTLALNGVGEPLLSDNGWHILRVTEIQPEHPLSFEEAREKIQSNLLEKKKHDARERWIEKLREAGEIEILDAGVAEFVKLNPYQDPNGGGTP
jgi:parvulin-like peptidyl-prolyl isomerase